MFARRQAAFSALNKSRGDGGLSHPMARLFVGCDESSGHELFAGILQPLALEPRQQHMGLKDAWGKPYQPLCDRVREVYGSLYEIAMSKETR